MPQHMNTMSGFILERLRIEDKNKSKMAEFQVTIAFFRDQLLRISFIYRAL